MAPRMTQPSGDLTVPAVVAAAARRFASLSALEDGNTRLTFEQVERAGRNAARAFIGYGLARGDRVALWAPNCAEWILAAIGVHMAGGIIVPMNTRLKGKEAGYIVRKSRARLLLCFDEFLDTDYPALLAAEMLPALEATLLMRGQRPGLRSFDEFLASHGDRVGDPELERVIASVGPDDVADIMFTSGTTGSPKGVMSSHGQTVRMFQAWSDAVGLERGDRYLIVNPFFHTFGYKAGWLACLLKGATILPVAVFDAAEVMRRVADDRVSVLPGPPTLFQTILAHPQRGSYDMSTLRLAVTGAAIVPPVLIARMRSELGFRNVITGYGLTESTGVVTMCRPGETVERIALTCGTALPGIEIRTVDDAGREVARGAAGEVLVRGFNVMRGYFEDPESTSQAIDAAGWLHTGDIGVIDRDGYLRITDRKKDMFIVGGFNCYPAEIETLLATHPAVAQAAVVGVPDERLGEVAKAFVVLRPAMSLDSPTLIAWCRDNMANYKVPRQLEIVASLPTTASGKVQRFVLRQQADS